MAVKILSPAPVGVGVGTSLIWAVDHTQSSSLRESGYARLKAAADTTKCLKTTTAKVRWYYNAKHEERMCACFFLFFIIIFFFLIFFYSVNTDRLAVQQKAVPIALRLI